MSVLIASTYYESTKQTKDRVQIPNKFWLNVQRDFISSYTQDFDFAVYLNTIKNKSLFSDCIVIGENDVVIGDERMSHRFALRHIVQYFRDHQDSYDAFCLLDSDCFPIKPNWLENILDHLSARKFKFAAIVRMENGDPFPHPAGLVIPSAHIQEDLFRYPEFFSGCKDLITGNYVRDTGDSMSFWNDKGKMIGQPLLRSNAVNIHPLYAGIYGDTFYHHGLGSRIRKVESEGVVVEPYSNYRAKPYWDTFGNYHLDYNIIFDMIKHPKRFISILRGERMEEHLNSKALFDYFENKRNDKFDVPPLDL